MNPMIKLTFMPISHHTCNALQMIEERPCLVYDPEYLAILPDMDRRCIPLVVCRNFTYDKSVFYRTITSDWDLVCSKHWVIHVSIAQ